MQATPPPSARRGGARHCAIDAPEDTNASKERMTNDEKRTIRTTHTYETLLDGGGQSRQTATQLAWASAPRGRWRWRWRSSAQSGEQASKRAKRRHADWQPVENMTTTTDRRVRT